MEPRIGWPLATLSVLTLSFGPSTATADRHLTAPGSTYRAAARSALADGPPCGQAATSPRPTFFQDEVGQPPVAAPDSPNHYTLTAHLGTHAFSSDWPAVPTLGYSTANAKVDYLGPTIVTRKGTPV